MSGLGTAPDEPRTGSCSGDFPDASSALRQYLVRRSKGTGREENPQPPRATNTVSQAPRRHAARMRPIAVPAVLSTRSALRVR